jgi:hypothetical protein
LSANVGSKLGFYEITALLGKGGMGEVYSARDTNSAASRPETIRAPRPPEKARTYPTNRGGMKFSCGHFPARVASGKSPLKAARRPRGRKRAARFSIGTRSTSGSWQRRIPSTAIRSKPTSHISGPNRPFCRWPDSGASISIRMANGWPQLSQLVKPNKNSTGSASSSTSSTNSAASPPFRRIRSQTSQASQTTRTSQTWNFH